MLGPIPAGGPLIGLVLGPVALVVYAIVLIGSTYIALRGRDNTGEVIERSGEGTTDGQ